MPDHPDSAMPRSEVPVVAVIALAAAFGTAAAGAHPTGSTIADVIWSGLFGAIVAVAASRAHRGTWLWMAVLALVGSSGWMLVVAGAAVVVALAGSAIRRAPFWLGSAIGALTMQALLRLSIDQFHGASALLAAAATAPVLLSGYSRSGEATRRRVGRSAWGLLGVGAIVLVGFGISLARAAPDVSDGVSGSRSALQSTRGGETAGAQEQLRRSLRRLERAEARLNSPWARPARALPIVGQQARALGVFATDGTDLVRAADRSVGVIDYDRMQSESGRFDLDRIRAARQPLADAAAAAARADDHLRELDSAWLVAPIRDRIDSYRDDVTAARKDAALAAQAARVVPALLGGDGERRYFIAFVTPSEQRGSGGFIGSFGEMTATDGRIEFTRSGFIGDLSHARPDGERTLTGPADYLARYGLYSPADQFGDVTFSPDFPSVGQVIEQLYPQSGGKPVDGVLQVDPYGLAALLTFTGPIDVKGLPEPLTSDNAARVLLHDQYRLFPGDSEQEDALSAAARTTFKKLVKAKLPSPRKFSRVLDPMVKEGRFKFHSIHAPEEELAAKIGLAWAMPKPAGHDLLAITTQNNGNSKIDYYLHRTIDYRVKIDPRSGEVEATTVVNLQNRATATSLGAGNKRGLPLGTNRSWLSLYSPLELTGARIGDLDLAVTRQKERGYNVYGQFLNIGPGQTVTITYTLRGRTATPAAYQLDLFPQPMVHPDVLSVSIDGGPGAMPGKGLKLTDDGPELTERRVIGTVRYDERRTLTARFGG